MKVLSDQKNSLLKRREIKFLVEAQGSPSFIDAQKQVAEQYKASEELVVVKAVRGKFGRDTFLIDTFIYESEKDKERIEPKKKVKQKKEEKK